MRFCFSLYLIAWSIQVMCQPSDTLSIDFQEVTIAENRLSIPFNDVSRSIEVITKQQIQELNTSSINEVLQLVGGVDIRQRGVHGVQADLSIRGGTFEQALVLINGVKMLDPQTGHHLMNLPITLEDIERIEVLKGPGARVFGQNAFAGAINIITKVQNDFALSTGIDYGAYGLLNAFTSINLPFKQIKQKISLSHNHSDGYRDNTDYHITNAFYQGQVNLGGKKLNLYGGYTARDFGANGFYGNETFTDQYEETRTSIISASYEARLGEWKISPKINWRRNTDNWQFRRQDPEFFQNFHTSHVLTGELHLSKTHGLGILGIGAEYNSIDLTSNNLGQRSRGQVGIHLENRFLLKDEQLDITPGIYLLRISDFGTQVFPGLDIGYRLDNNWKLYSNIGLTSRIPSFTDLYYEDSGNIGNPELQTEKALTFELGASHKSRTTLFQLSYFRRDARDLIDWFKIDTDDRWMPDNFGSAVYNGLDLSVTLSLSKERNKAFLQTLKVNYLYLNASLGDSEVALSRNALENLNHQLIINPRFRITNELSGNLLFKYNDRASLDDYSLVDANLQYEINEWSFYVKASNLLNTDYRETNLVPMPGRWMMIGLRYRMYK